ncbi:MAG TPA: hypothetical protein VGU46_01180 [Acidobacteriaceae bacterium]|nr:hypothetical protein [Acidobacteriaceae bacterium]
MRRSILLVALVALSASLAQGQVSVYLTSSTARLSGVETGDVQSGGSHHEQYADFWASGVGGGVTFNFLSGPVKLGIDLRGSTRPGTAGADTAFAGFKVGFNPPVIPLKPYIQASGGYVGTRTVNVSTVSSGGSSSATVGGTFTNRYAAWEIVGGVDYRLAKLVDLRLIEVGGGKGSDIFGGLSSAPGISLFTINSGLVVHF